MIKQIFNERKASWHFTPWIDGFILVMLASIWGYVILRAVHVDLTHDEVLTLEMIQGKGSSFYTANNHWLNTGLIWIFIKLFGTAEWILRIPALIGFFIYSLFAWKWMKRLDSFGKLLAFAFLFLNPYFLDFFSLARGYGLSMGLSLASIYSLLNVPMQKESQARIRAYSMSLIWALFGSMANLILINLVAIVGLFLIAGFWKDRFFLFAKGNRKLFYKLVGLGLVTCIIVLMEVKWLFFLKKSNELYFGGDRGFVEDTISVLIHRYIYLQYYGEEFWLNLRTIVIVFFWISLLLSMVWKKAIRWRWIMIVFSLFVGVVLIQFYGMHAKLPRERTSLIFYLLFACALVAILEVLGQFRLARKWAWTVTLPLMVWMGIHFYKNMNLDQCFEWRADAGIAEKVASVQREGMTKDQMLSVSDPELHPSIRYYWDRHP